RPPAGGRPLQGGGDRVRRGAPRRRRGRRSLGGPDHGARRRVLAQSLHGAVPRRDGGVRTRAAGTRPHAPRVFPFSLPRERRLDEQRAGCARASPVGSDAATMPEPTYLAPGVVLQDRYEIADEIGRGGASIVYRARDRRVGADIALKLLVPPPAAARRAGQRPRRRGQAAQHLSPRDRVPDVGSARLAGQETVTQTGGLVGTVDYAAPEQLAGARGDARVDEYALGVTLYYALTGELPPRPRPAARARAHAADGHHPRGRRPEIPAWLDAVVARATMPNPDDRFPAIGLVAEALSRRDDVAEYQPAS